MIGGTKMFYTCILNKGFSSKCPEEDWRVQCPKRCDNNNTEEDTSLNISSFRICPREYLSVLQIDEERKAHTQCRYSF